MQDDLKEKGYSLIECSSCLDFFYRKQIGESPNGKRKYYQDENGRAWRGKKCPTCSTKAHTKYMRKKRHEDEDSSPLS